MLISEITKVQSRRGCTIRCTAEQDSMRGNGSVALSKGCGFMDADHKLYPLLAVQFALDCVEFGIRRLHRALYHRFRYIPFENDISFDHLPIPIARWPDPCHIAAF